MDEAEWRDVHGILLEWGENPPAELFLRAYFKYESPNERAQPGDKFFGDDIAGPAKDSGVPSISTAPPEVRAAFEHFKTTQVNRGT